MGYHGFGMRKEVYTRKPKEAFKRLKKHQPTRTGKVKDARESPPGYYVHKPFKPAYKRWWFRLSALAILLFILYTYFNRTIFAEQRLEKAVQEFEAGGINQYYNDHKSGFDSLIALFERNNGKLTAITYGYRGPFRLHIRSEDYEDQRAGRPRGKYNRRSNDFNKEMEDEIVKGDLLTRRSGIRQAFTSYWTYELVVHNITDINKSFLEYLQTSSDELNQILLNMAQNGYEMEMYSYGYELSFQKFSHGYKITFDRKITENSADSTGHLLAPGVSWVNTGRQY